MKWLALAAVLLAWCRIHAQPGNLEAGGYVKFLSSRSEGALEPVSYDQLLHARLNTRWLPLDNLSALLELRGRVFYGDDVERTPGFADQLGHDGGLGTLGLKMWDEGKSVGYGEIDRFNVNWVPGKWQVTVGRQRIAWGTNLVWNPIDLFNPLSVLDFDYEERPSVDAVRVQYYTGEVSKVEMAFKPGSNATRQITAAQWTTNRWDYDFHFLGGSRGHEWFAGTGWAGDICGGGFRGEVLASGIPGNLRTAGSATTMVSAALSGDYTFPNSLYLHVEGLYNDEGVTGDAAADRSRATSLGLLSPARWSTYGEVGYDISPLVRGDVFAIVNPSDGSRVILPTLTWSVVTDVDLTFLGLFFGGRSSTEFGQLGTSAYLRCKWSY